MKAVLCTLIIFSSILASERSLYGFTLASILFGFIFVSLLIFIGLLKRIFDLTDRALVLISATLSPIIAAVLYQIAFGKYLNGGTLFLRSYPLVEDGYVTIFGKIYVIFYTIALVFSLIVAMMGKKNGKH